MKIILIGFACCYKSSAGKLLAQKLNYAHIDVDKVVEESAGKSIADIFANEGEAAFRDKESAVLMAITKLDNVVVSCGGGSVLSQCFADVAAGSTVVWLTASPEAVHSRLGGVQRPLFDNMSIEQLSAAMDMRVPYYTGYANCTVITDNKTSEQVASEIVTLLCANR